MIGRVTEGRRWVPWVTFGLVVWALAGDAVAQQASNIELVGQYRTSRSAVRVLVADNIAYVGGFAMGAMPDLEILDVSDPTSPTRVTLYHDVSCVDMFLADHRLYVASGWAWLEIFDVSTPSAPMLLYRYAVGGGNTAASGVWVVGNLAYVARGDRGLLVLDVTNPTSPTYHASYDTTGTAMKICVSGDRAYLADGPGGLRVFNVSNPAAPTLLATFPTTGAIEEVRVVGNRAYLGCNSSAFPPYGIVQIINVSNPALPVLLGEYPTLEAYWWIGGIDLVGTTAYVANGLGGLRVLDVADPSSPTLVGFYEKSSTPAWAAQHVQVYNDLAFVVFYDQGLLILRYTPARLSLRSPWWHYR